MRESTVANVLRGLRDEISREVVASHKGQRRPGRSTEEDETIAKQSVAAMEHYLRGASLADVKEILVMGAERRVVEDRYLLSDLLALTHIYCAVVHRLCLRDIGPGRTGELMEALYRNFIPLMKAFGSGTFDEDTPCDLAAGKTEITNPQRGRKRRNL